MASGQTEKWPQIRLGFYIEEAAPKPPLDYREITGPEVLAAHLRPPEPLLMPVTATPAKSAFFLRLGFVDGQRAPA